jgi:uncharacterized membrane protein
MTAPAATPPRARPDPISLVLGAVSLFFPLIALVLSKQLGPLAVTLALVAVLVLRSLAGLARSSPAGLAWAALAAAAALGLLSLIDAGLAMRLYPALMTGAMLFAFARSLAKPPTMIERFARMAEPNLAESGVRYTRTVTWVWCAFFVLNGAVALWTALAASLETWAIYNGVVSYILMGALLGGEFLVRGLVRKRDAAGNTPG